MSATAVGDVHLYFDEFRFILLKDCFYVPSFKRNLISVACLIKDSYLVSFNKTVVIKKKTSPLSVLDGCKIIYILLNLKCIHCWILS